MVPREPKAVAASGEGTQGLRQEWGKRTLYSTPKLTAVELFTNLEKIHKKPLIGLTIITEYFWCPKRELQSGANIGAQHKIWWPEASGP